MRYGWQDSLGRCVFLRYVLRMDRPLLPNELSLFDFPQNTWAGENIFMFALQQTMGWTVRNPCLAHQVVHMHCELPTRVGTLVVGERRSRKRQSAADLLVKLRRMSKNLSGVSVEDVWRTRVPVVAT